MHILILDASQRSALAATRSLGAAGHRISVADHAPHSLAGASRYAAAELVYPSPTERPDEFLEWARRSLAHGPFDAALPATEVTTDLLVRHRGEWPDVGLPFAPIETIDALSDKVSLYRRALSAGVPVPTSVVIERAADVDRAIAEIGFPAVLKPRRSRLMRPDRFVPTVVRRAQDRKDLDRILREEAFHDYPFLYQEVVSGSGYGVFALYDRGQPVAWFAHERLREKPPEGGVSVLCESREVPANLRTLAGRLLDDAQWHGVAMVEFKGPDVLQPYLMEINARLWGSLQLAVDAGIDFPKLLIEQLGEGAGRQQPAVAYRCGRRLRWWLGDLDRLYIVSKQRNRNYDRRLLSEWLAFLTPHPFSTRHETFRWRDPWPAVRELKTYVGDLMRG